MGRETKKSVVLYVLSVLREYSDEDHRLSQKDILDLLRTKYDVTIERRTVKSAILDLMDAGFDISYSEVTRDAGKDSENAIWTDFYLVRDFTDGELRLLIDTVLCSKTLKSSFAREMSDKLLRLGSPALRSSQRKGVLTVPEASDSLLMYAEDIGNAISYGRKISFMYNEWQADGSLSPVLQEKLLFSPYRLAVIKGVYYVVGKAENAPSLSSYRLDKMTCLEITDKSVEPNRDNISEYINSHPNMQGGNAADCEIIIRKDRIHLLISAFGSDHPMQEYTYEDNEYFRVRLTADEEDICSWAILNSESAVVIKPTSLFDRLDHSLYPAHELCRLPDCKYNSSVRSAKDNWVSFWDVDIKGRREHKRFTECTYALFVNNNESNFDFLGNYILVEELIVCSNPVKDLDVVGNLPNLRAFDLRYTDVGSIDFLAKLDKLCALSLADNPIRSYNVLYKIHGLKFFMTNKATAKYIDLDKLREANPAVRIIVFDEMTGNPINEFYYMVDMANPRNDIADYPVNLYRDMFPKRFIDISMKDNPDFCDTMESFVFSTGRKIRDPLHA